MPGGANILYLFVVDFSLHSKYFFLNQNYLFTLHQLRVSKNSADALTLIDPQHYVKRGLCHVGVTQIPPNVFSSTHFVILVVVNLHFALNFAYLSA